MACEIEARVRVTDVAAVERALESLGADYLGAWLETDTFLDHPDGRLTEHDTALRLRLSCPLDGTAAEAGESALLTYKGPRMEGRMKVRVEHQVSVPDPKAMTEILRGLEYRETFCFEKRRRRWCLEGAEVTVDEVPHLGTFVEVEAADETEVDRLLDELGFAGCERITDTYVHMLAERLGDRMSGQSVRFDNQNTTGGN